MLVIFVLWFKRFSQELVRLQLTHCNYLCSPNLPNKHPMLTLGKHTREAHSYHLIQSIHTICAITNSPFRSLISSSRPTLHCSIPRPHDIHRLTLYHLSWPKDAPTTVRYPKRISQIPLTAQPNVIAYINQIYLKNTWCTHPSSTLTLGKDYVTPLTPFVTTWASANHMTRWYHV